MERIALSLAALTLAASFAGCGSERTFSAEEFVDAANEQGAGLSLGGPLDPGGGSGEIYAVRLTAGPSATAPAAEGEEHGGGSMKVTGSPDEASEDHERCEETATLVCYRAANVALRFEGLTPEERARLDQALTALGDE